MSPILHDDRPGGDPRHALRSRDRSLRHARTRQRILRGTAAIPSMVTLGNGIAGFAAIHFATRPMPPGLLGDPLRQAEALQWISTNLVLAAWMILLAMFCDAMDGRLARMTRRTSDFGGQLDSLCDAISFGVAPAMLMLRAVQGVLVPYLGVVDIHPQAPVLGRALWVIAALFASCAVLRLARFNVENDPDLSAHMYFKGLPSPGAALAVASLALLHEHLSVRTSWWDPPDWVPQLLVWLMPVVTLIAALAMVSNLRYRHVVNQYVGGRKPFGYIVKLVVVVLAAIVDFQLTLATLSIVYLLSGPVGWARGRIHKKTEAQQPGAGASPA